MPARMLLSLTILWLSLGVLRAQDDSEVRPPVTKGDLEIVKRAREILHSPAVWNRADTRECPDSEKSFSLYCALEKATQEVSTHFEHRGAAMQEARFAIDEITHKKDYEHRLMGYNNDPTTTFADIQKVFDLMEARIAKRLKEEPPAPPHHSELEVLERTRALLSSEEHWNRAERQNCSDTGPKIGLYCALRKAAIDLNGSFDDEGAAIQQVRAAISELAPNASHYTARLVNYNNDPTVSFADLQKLLQVVHDRLARQ